MRLFIVGQKWLAAELLKSCLAGGHEVTGCAAPDEGDALARAALERGVRCSVSGRSLSAADIDARTDLILAAHAHCFIPAEARSKSRLGAIGFHPSLLPLHRGRDAVRWAVHMRERVTGGTIYWMDDGADTGPIALQDWCLIRDDDTAASLWRRELGPMGLRLFDRALYLAEIGQLPAIAQDHEAATWEPAFKSGRLAAGVRPITRPR